MTIKTTHLNEEILALLLDRHGNRESADLARTSHKHELAAADIHLADCAGCRDELERLRSTFAGLRFALTEMADQRPVRRLPLSMPARTRFRLVPAASLMTAAAAMFAAVALYPSHPAASSRMPAAVLETAGVPPLSDTALLESIDRDLTTSVPPSLAPLAPATAASVTSSRK